MERAIARARALREAGNPKAALSDLPKLGPARRNIPLMREYASCFVALGRNNEAEELLQRLVELAPDSVASVRPLARLMAARGEVAGAAALLLSTAARRPEDVRLRLEMAEGCNQIGCPEATLTLFPPDEIAALPLEHRAPALLRIARAELRRRNTEEAERCFRLMLELEPRNLAALLGAAMLRAQAGAYGESLALFERAVAVEPGNWEAKLGVLRALIELNRLDEAGAALTRCDRSGPAKFTIALLEAQLLGARGEFARAQQALEGVASLASDDAARLRLGRALRRAKAESQAEAVLTALADNGSGPAMSELGMLCRQRGDVEAALTWFERAAAALPGQPEPLMDMAACIDELRGWDDASPLVARVQELALPARGDWLRTRLFEMDCMAHRLDSAAARLAEWPDTAELPPRVIRLALGLHYARHDWDAAMTLFADKISPGRGSAFIELDNPQVEWLVSAARATGRQAEVLDLLESWPGATLPPAVRLRDTMREDLCLLHELGAAPSTRVEPPADPYRAERARRMAAALRGNGCDADGTVLICSDRNYLIGAAVALGSALQFNARALRRCRFNVVLADDVLDEGAPIMRRLAESYGVALDIVAAHQLGRVADGLRTTWGGFAGHKMTEAAYYRILAALRLAEAGERGRLLYLDSDVCVGPDLAQLMNHDLRGRPLAARPELGNMPGMERAARRIGVPPETYFNSGVMLIDLGHEATVPALERALEIAVTMPDKLTCLDQCALNLAFVGQTVELPPAFNNFVRSDTEIVKGATATVTHYLFRPKPWDPSYPNANNAGWTDAFCALAEVLSPEQMRFLVTPMLLPGARTAKA